MSADRPWTKFYWGAWETDPALSMCSMAAQGFWMRLLCLCAKEGGHLLIGGKRPSFEQLAILTRQAVEDVELWIGELLENGVCSRSKGGVIYSRRMRDEREKYERSAAFGRRGGRQRVVVIEENGQTVDETLKPEEEEEEEIEPPKAPKGTKPQGKAATRRPDKPTVTKADVEACWRLANVVSRKRSSTADVERELRAAANRGHSPADVARGLAAYFAGDDATRDGCSAAKGVHRMIANDRWQSHVPTNAEPAWPDDRWARFVQHWRNGVPWSAELGPPPGDPGCQVPAHLLISTADDGRAA